jgi:hypothetical protein
MFGTYFYHAATRKFISVFGTMFNNIHIQRTRDDATTQDIKVPLTYGSYEKTLARLSGDPDLDRQIAGISPALSFVIGAPKYDNTRKLQSTNQRCIKSDTGTKTQYIGVPYNFEVSLFIYSKEEEDGLQVLEQILPYFTPSLTLTVIMDDELGYKVDVPVVLQNIVYEDSKNWGSFTDRRYLLWELKFLMKGEFAGPVSSTARPLIRLVKVPFRSTLTREIMEEVDVQPGLTANGEPTSSANNSISRSLIMPDDNYGYIVEIISGLTANT